MAFFRRLSFKISAAILVGTLFGTLVIGWLAFSFTKAVLQRSIMEQQLDLARQIMDKIDRMFYERMADIEGIATEDTLENFLLSFGPEASIPEQYTRVMLRRMNELTVLTGPWDALTVLDKERRVALSTEEVAEASLQDKNGFYRTAHEEVLRGKLYYSDMTVSSESGRPTVIFAAPVRDAAASKRPVIGTVIGDFSWGAVLPILEEAPAHAVLLDRKGVVIAGGAAYDDRPVQLKKSSSPLISAKLEEGRSLSMVVPGGESFLGEPVLASLVPESGYLSYRGNGWGLVLEVPTRIAFAPATQAAMKLVSLLIPALAVSSAVIFLLMAKSIVHPIKILTSTIQAITHGDLTRRVPLRSDDEIGTLADSFNTMAARLEESHQVLERKVQQRTAELSKANEDLKKEMDDRRRLEKIVIQSEKMAAVGQLAGGVAHEINNPLGIILGFAQGAIRRLDPGSLLEMPLKSIEREALRCKQLVQDLLVFSRAGKAEAEEVDLNQALESFLSLIQAQTKVKSVEFLKNFQSDIPKVTVNKNQIQQVIINLCNNAIDAMPNGGKLTLSTRKARLDGAEAVEIEVRDTGEGILKEVQARIFEPFFTTKEVGKGTGLGLSLVYEIVKKHMGTIRFTSEPGQGAVFFVNLPVRPLSPS